MNSNHQLPIDNNTENILVSVVIPVYNRTSELERTIHSVLNQSWQNFEILVVDDGSDVDIKHLCDSLNDERIRFFRNNEHKNANVARNRGIREARGEYIAMLDSDDEFLPGHLERRLLKIREWNCDGIFGSAYFDYGTSRELILSRPRGSSELMINYLLSDGFAPTPSHFYRREAVLEILWDETMERHQDFDFTVRFSDKFLFLSDYEPTIVVDRRPQENRNYKYNSCIRFIEKHKDQIPGRIYSSYHFSMYLHVQSNANIDRRIERYYARNSYKYIYAIPFHRFAFVHKPRGISYFFIFLKFILLHGLFFLRMVLFRDLPPEMKSGMQ